MNMSSESSGNFTHFPLMRQPVHLVIIYCLAYAIIFIVGLVGNMFVVFAVALYPNMRNVTNYFITSLAVADMLIIIFCLPATLMNNILSEWWFGNILCKMSVYINGATSCSSVYTLVAVTADRYFAICHTLRYNIFEKKNAIYINLGIWLVSCFLFLPWPLKYGQIHYDVGDGITARICVAQFENLEEERLYFLIGNILLAFVIPLVAITVCYSYIFITIYRHRSMAVDKMAAEREHRVRMRVTNMMLTVIFLFAASWLPLYVLFIYLYYDMPKLETTAYHVTVNILRPCFQLLSLSNSCINPILYAYFSLKFRRAFRETLLLPCRRRYHEVQQFARSTVRRVRSSKMRKAPGGELEPDDVGSPQTDRTSLYSGGSKKVNFKNAVYRTATIKSNVSAFTDTTPSTTPKPKKKKKAKAVILDLPELPNERSPLRRRKTPHPGASRSEEIPLENNSTFRGSFKIVPAVFSILKNKQLKKSTKMKKAPSYNSPEVLTPSPMTELIVLTKSPTPTTPTNSSPNWVIHGANGRGTAPIITMQDLDRFSIASSAIRSICSGDADSSTVALSPSWCPHRKSRRYSETSPLCRRELKLSVIDSNAHTQLSRTHLSDTHLSNTHQSGIDSTIIISNPSAEEMNGKLDSKCSLKFSKVDHVTRV